MVISISSVLKSGFNPKQHDFIHSFLTMQSMCYGGKNGYQKHHFLYKNPWEKLTKVSLRKNSVQFSSVAQSCSTLCDPMNHSMPGLPVHHQLPEFTQTHVHRVGDAIQPSHPLSSPSPPAPNPSQHQSLFQ